MLLLKIKGMQSINQFPGKFLWKLLQLIKKNPLKLCRLSFSDSQGLTGCGEKLCCKEPGPMVDSKLNMSQQCIIQHPGLYEQEQSQSIKELSVFT